MRGSHHIDCPLFYFYRDVPVNCNVVMRESDAIFLFIKLILLLGLMLCKFECYMWFFIRC